MQAPRELEVERNIHNHLVQVGEPLQFGTVDGMVEFLVMRGFSQVYNVTSEADKKAYFPGANEGRAVSSLLNFVHAVIE